MNGTVRQSEIEIIVAKCVEETVDATLLQVYDGVDRIPQLQADLIEVVRDELVKADIPVQQKRKAIVQGTADDLDAIRSYLPANFTAHESSGTIFGDVIEIEGFDRAGWSLDGYVIPRLASGLISAKEIE